jgi:uncharacterized protein YecE (DUF72 family)
VNAAQNIRIGTSGFTAAGWQGSFYPLGLNCRFSQLLCGPLRNSLAPDRKELGVKDSRWVHFSVKIPQVITHEKVLLDCDGEFNQFISTMSDLGEKLGPMVLQLPFFNRSAFKTQADSLSRLVPVLKKLPREHKFAIEIRNKEWLDGRFAGLLREHHIALVLQDRSLMPGPTELAGRFDPVTTDWTYIRWLGDRKGIEEITKTWNKVVVDRTNQLSSWVDFRDQTTKRGVTVYAYANNHYVGFGPATVELFHSLWHAKGLPEITRPQRKPQKELLFDL